MPESTRPLLKGDYLPSLETEYKELLKIEADPTKTLYVGDIRIAVSNSAVVPFINVRLNGTPYLTDFPLLDATVTLAFGRSLKLQKHKVPIVVEIKRTAAGACAATAFATGIEC
jgi:hypothetical protein